MQPTSPQHDQHSEDRRKDLQPVRAKPISGTITLIGALLLAFLGSLTPAATAQDQSRTGSVAPLQAIAPMTGIAQVSSGWHTCVLTQAGAVYCWGRNDFGQLADGTTEHRAEPVAVSGLSSGILGVAAGGGHTCALTGPGAVLCWGWNRDGQLGDGTSVTSSAPVPVSGLGSGVSAISAGHHHSCALTSTGSVYCWGANNVGAVGDGTTTMRMSPVLVTGLSGKATQISSGGYHTCALLESGVVKCWGYNNEGQLGDGTTTTRTSAVTVTGLSGLGQVTQLATGGTHTCVVAGDKTYCWGRNDEGQLGDGTTTDRLMPVEVIGVAALTSVDAGHLFTCGVASTGVTRCWGANEFGQLADGATVNRSAPFIVAGLPSTASEVALGLHHACVRLSSGGLRCWGFNAEGQLGDGSRINRRAPITVQWQSVLNGDVELPAITEQFVKYNSGAAVGGWTVQSGSVDLVTNWSAYDGRQSIDLNGAEAGTIFQDIPTVVGAGYLVKLAVSGNSFCPPATKQLEVYWGDQLAATLSFDSSSVVLPNLRYDLYSLPVTAQNSVTRLLLRSLTTGGCGPVVDALSVEYAADPVLPTPTATSTPTPIPTPTPTTATISGTVVIAGSNAALAQARVCINGTNKCSTTNNRGEYRLTAVPPGTRTLRVTRSSYATLDVPLTLSAGQTVTQKFALVRTPAANEVRIVLTWTDTTQDLDSFLWVPKRGGQPYRVEPGQTGDNRRFPFAMVERDLNDGLNSTYIVRLQPGTYRFAVYNSSASGVAASPKLSASGAVVEVYDSRGLRGRYKVPAGTGLWWNVFTYTTSTRRISPVNTVSDVRPLQ